MKKDYKRKAMQILVLKEEKQIIDETYNKFSSKYKKNAFLIEALLIGLNTMKDMK